MKFIYPLAIVFISFAKISVINFYYGTEVLKFFVLFTSILIFLVELENVKADTLRDSSHYSIKDNYLISFATLLLCFTSGVWLLYENTPNSIAYTISAITIVESLEQSYVRHFDDKKKLRGIILRFVNLVLLVFDCLLVSILLAFVSAFSFSRFKFVSINSSLTSGNLKLVMIALMGRLRDVGQNYILINAVSDKIFFGFYLYLRVVQNLTGLVYSFLRSDKELKLNKLKSIVLRADIVFLALVIFGILIDNFYYIILLLPIVLSFENLSVQFLMFGDKYSQNLHLMVNANAIVACLGVLLFFWASGNVTNLAVGFYMFVVSLNLLLVVRHEKKHINTNSCL